MGDQDSSDTPMLEKNKSLATEQETFLQASGFAFLRSHRQLTVDTDPRVNHIGCIFMQ